MSVKRVGRPWAAALLVAALGCGGLRAEDAPGVLWPADGLLSVSAPVAGSRVVLGTSQRTAGAIDSLTWNGVEFVNSFDHGRQLQSALHFDGYGECENPTEAGSSADGRGDRSTSRLLSLKADRRSISTVTRMAYWLGPGETAGTCPLGAGRQTSPLSDVVLKKRVTIGVPGVPNAIRYDATFDLAQPRQGATIEVATAYLTPAFSRFWTFNPRSDALAPLSDGPGEQPLPVILATPDGSHALGVWSPDLPQPDNPGLGYGRWRFDTLPGPGNATVKWNCVRRIAPVRAGPHPFTCYAVIGTLAEVREGMRRLARKSGRP